MRLRKEPAIQVKSPEQVERMYAAGQVVARTLTVLKEAVRPGISTAELDSIAERSIRAAGAVPSFLGYFGFPASICASGVSVCEARARLLNCWNSSNWLRKTLSIWDGGAASACCPRGVILK